MNPLRPTGPAGDSGELSGEERMLITIRDTLYEGSWADFTVDLRRRLEGRAYVFELEPESPHLEPTIRRHLQLIHDLRRREEIQGWPFGSTDADV